MALCPAAQMPRGSVGIEIARDEGGNEVGQFHPGVGGLKDLGRRPLAMQDLRPVPLAAIGAAALVEILLADLLAFSVISAASA